MENIVNKLKEFTYPELTIKLREAILILFSAEGLTEEVRLFLEIEYEQEIKLDQAA